MNVLYWVLLAGLLAGPAAAQKHDTAGMQKPASEADSAVMSGMEKMDHEMAAAAMTGNADHDFVAMMIPHHRGAVDMAQVELKYGKDPELRKLATSIIAAQKKEIVMMQRWMISHP